MKIAVSSPDGLGDFILRLPLFRALEKARHSLQIWMLSPAAELAEILLPTAKVERIATHPYTREARRAWRPFPEEFARIKYLPADRYVVALYQPSFFDEMWIDHGCGNTPIAGLISRDEFWPSETLLPARKLSESYSIRVEVDEDLPEIDKNRALAQAILGAPCEEDCRIQVPVESVELGRRLLQQHNLVDKKFWLVCAGSRPGLDAKDWGESNWIAALSTIEKQSGTRFVFIGNNQEAASIERIRAALSSPQNHLNLAARPPGFAGALGLAALSEGYLGRDSGPMHLAASIGRPVLAVFAGGHWGRFFPQAPRGIVLGARGACRACAQGNALHDPWCIKNLPLPELLAAWNHLPQTTSLEIRQWHEPGAPLDSDFVRQALENRRARMRKDRPASKYHAIARSLISR